MPGSDTAGRCRLLMLAVHQPALVGTCLYAQVQDSRRSCHNQQQYGLSIIKEHASLRAWHWRYN